MNRCSRLVAFGLAVAGCPVPAPASPAAATGYAITARWTMGDAGGWDYLAVDAAGGRLFVTRSNHVAVLDLSDGHVLGQIGPTNGVHGVALAPQLGKGYASNGRGDAVSVFDLKSLATTATIAIDGHNPDAIVFDAPTARVFTFNGRSNDASVIDANTDKPIARIPLGGKPEFAVSDGKGRLYVNIEDRAELVMIDARSMKAVARWPLAECKEPSGLAIDVADARLFSVCGNGHLVVTDAKSGRHVATLAIGQGPDAVAFDATRHLIFSSNGADGTLTVIRQHSADRYAVLGNLPTQRSARTLALDPRSHRVFLATAEFEPRPAGAAPQQRPAIKAGSFAVLVAAPSGMP